MYLYHYAPKQNTITQQGIKSTAKSQHGWQKYTQRYGVSTKDEVIQKLKQLDPDRPYAVSMFRDPISDQAPEQMRAFRDAKRLYRVDYDKLKNNLLLISVVAAVGKQPHKVKQSMKQHTDWKHAQRGKFLFSKVPHYIVSVRDGVIPPQMVEEIK